MYNKNEQAQLEAIARQQKASAIAKADAKSREYFANIRKIYERDLINNIAMKKGDSSYRGVMQTASFMNNYKEVGYTDSQVKNMTETQLLANAIMYNIATSVAGDQISVPKKEAKQAAVNAIYALDILSGREDSIDSDYEAVLMNLAGVSKHGKYYVRSMIGEEKDVVKQFSPIAYDSFGSADDTRVAGKGVLRVNMFTDSFLLKYASTIFESSRTIEGSIEEERMARATGNPMNQRFGDTSHTLMNFTAPALSLVEMILIGKLTGGAGSAMGLAARGSTLLSRTAIIANSVAKTQYAGRRAEYGLGEEYTTKMKTDDLVFDVVSMWAGMAVTDAVTDMMWSGMFKNAHISSFGKTFSGNMTNRALLKNTAVNVLYGLSNTTLDTAIDYGIYHSFVSLGGEMSVSNRQMFDFREGESKLLTFSRSVMKRQVFRTANKIIGSIGSRQRGAADARAKKRMLTIAWYNEKKAAENLKNSHPMYVMSMLLNRASFAIFNDTPNRLSTALAMKGLNPENLAKKIKHLNESSDFRDVSRLFTSLMLDMEARNNAFFTMFYRDPHKLSATGLMNRMINISSETTEHILNIGNAPFLYRKSPGDEEFVDILNRDVFAGKNYNYEDKVTALEVIKQFSDNRIVVDVEQKELQNRYGATLGQARDILRMEDDTQINMDDIERISKRANLIHKKLFEGSDIEADDANVATIVKDIFKNKEVGLMEPTDSFSNSVRLFAKLARDIHDGVEGLGDERAAMLDRFITTFSNPNVNEREAYTGIDMLIKDYFGLDMREFGKMSDAIGKIVEDEVIKTGIEDFATINALIKTTKNKVVDTLIHKVSGMLSGKGDFSTIEFLNSMNQLQSLLHVVNVADLRVAHKEFMNQLADASTHDKVKELFKLTNREDIETIASVLRRFTGVANTLEKNGAINEVYNVLSEIHQSLQEKRFKGLQLTQDEESLLKWSFQVIQEGTSTDIVKDDIDITINGKQKVEVGGTHETFNAVLSAVTGKKGIEEFEMESYKALYAALSKKYVRETVAVRILEDKAELYGVYNSDEDIRIKLPLGNVVYNVKRNAVDVTMDRDIGSDALLKGLVELYAKISLKPLEMISKRTNSTVYYKGQSRSITNTVPKTRLQVGGSVLGINEIKKSLDMIPGFRQLINELSLESYVTKNLYNTDAGDIDITRIEQLLHRALRTHKDTIPPKDKRVIVALLNKKESLVPTLANVMYISDISKSFEQTLAMKGHQDRIILSHSISSKITDVGYMGTYPVFSVSYKLLPVADQAAMTNSLKAIGASRLPVSGSTGDKFRFIIVPRDENGRYSSSKISHDILSVMMKSSNITKSQENEIYNYMASNGSSGEFKFSESNFNLMSSQLKILEVMVNYHVNKSKSSGEPYNYLKELNEAIMDVLRDPDLGGYGETGDVLSTYVKDRVLPSSGRMLSEALQEFRSIDPNAIMVSIKDNVYNLKEVKAKFGSSYSENLSKEIDRLIDSDRYIINKKDIVNSIKALLNSPMKGTENLAEYLLSIEDQLTGLDSGTRTILEGLQGDHVGYGRIKGNTIMKDFVSLTRAYGNEYDNRKESFVFKDFLDELNNSVGWTGMRLFFEGNIQSSLVEIDKYSYDFSNYITRFNKVNSEKENYGSVAELLTLFQSSGLSAVEDPAKFAKRTSSITLASNASDLLIKQSVENFTQPMVIRITQSQYDSGPHYGPADDDGVAYYGKEFAPFFNGLTGSDRSTGKSVVNGFFGLFKNNAAHDRSIGDNEMTMNIHNLKFADQRFIENAKNKGLLVEKDGGRNIVITLTTNEDKEAFFRSIRLHQEIESKATTTDILDQKFVSVFSVLRPTTSLSEQSVIEFIYGAQDMSSGSYIDTTRRSLTTHDSPSTYVRAYSVNETRSSHQESIKYNETLANKLKPKHLYDGGIELADKANRAVAVSSGTLLELAVKRQEESYKTGKTSDLEKDIVKWAVANKELTEDEVVSVIHYLVDKEMISLVKNNNTGKSQMFIGFVRSPITDDSHYVAYPIREIFSDTVPQVELTRAAAGDQHADFDGDTGIHFGVSNINLRKYVTGMSHIISKKSYDEAPLEAIETLFTETSRRNNINRVVQSFYNKFHGRSFIGESNTKLGSILTGAVFDVIDLTSANTLSNLKLFSSRDPIEATSATLAPLYTAEDLFLKEPFTDKNIEDYKEFTINGVEKPIDPYFVDKVVLYNDKTASLDNKKDIMPLGSYRSIATKEIDYGSENHRAIVRLVNDYEGNKMVIVGVKKRSSLDETILDMHIPREYDKKESMISLYNELTAKENAKENMSRYLGPEFGMKSFKDQAEPYRLNIRKKYRTQVISFDNNSRLKMATFGSVTNKVDAAFTSTTSVTPMGYDELSKQDMQNYMISLFVGANVDITSIISTEYNREETRDDFRRVDNIQVLNSTLEKSNHVAIGTKYYQNYERIINNIDNPELAEANKIMMEHLHEMLDGKLKEGKFEKYFLTFQKEQAERLKASDHIQDSIMRGEIAKQRKYLSQLNSINKLMDPTQKAITSEDITNIADVVNRYNLTSLATIAEMTALPAPLRSAFVLAQKIVSLNTLIGSSSPDENKTLQGEIDKMLPGILSENSKNISHILKMYSLNMQEGEEFSIIRLLDEDNKTIMRNAVIAGRFVETMEETIGGFYSEIQRISDNFNANVYFRDEGVEDMNSLVDAVYTKIQGYNPKVDNQGNFIFARDSISALFRDLGIELSDTHDNVVVINTGRREPGVLRSKYLIDKKSGNVLKREALFNKLKYSMEIRDDEFIQSNKQMIFSALRDLLDGDSQSTLNLMDSGLNRKSVKILSKLFKESHGTFEFDPNVLNKDLTDKYLFMSDENLVPNLFHDTIPLIENLGRVDLTKMTPDC